MFEQPLAGFLAELDDHLAEDHGDMGEPNEENHNNPYKFIIR